jgi:hypothetical protein
MTTRLDHIISAVENVSVLGRRDAAQLADVSLDCVIEVLRKDPSLPQRSSREWRLVLADAHPRLTDRIASTIAGKAPLEQVLQIIRTLP